MMAPLPRFHLWLDEAKARDDILEPTAMALATADASGAPSCRIVLCKQADERGFTFYTNSESRKGRELAENPRASLCFFWMPIRKQVRVEGVVERVSDADSDVYFASRHPTSRRGAWASAQSQTLESRDVLVARLKDMETRFPDDDAIPRPPHWYGFRVVPTRIEFWQEADHRLHQREVYVREGNGWRVELLNP